ncbi:MAG: cytochrome c biogenesis protein CcdA [candidate division NC10 bacterium]|nr:cytochrome c biogenesis protein CcdA [candidate division NC10 bacterium]
MAQPVDVTSVVAFTAGVFSFLSPCVLPLVPSYLSFVAGMSLQELEEGKEAKVRRAVFLNALLFIIGFSTVFVTLGASFSLVGQLLLGSIDLVRKAGGILIILFGLFIAGILKVPFLMRERRLHFQERPAGYLGAVLVGAAFGAGWIPCVGPILGSILTLAGTSETAGRGVALLGAYSLGLGVPFLLSALALNSFNQFFQRFRPYMRVVEVAAGLILVAIGVLLFTGYLTLLNSYLIGLTPAWLWERL